MFDRGEALIFFAALDLGRPPSKVSSGTSGPERRPPPAGRTERRRRGADASTGWIATRYTGVPMPAWAPIVEPVTSMLFGLAVLSGST